MRMHKDGCPLLYSVITPAGTITCPHCDNTGSGHIILLTYGIKLVLWWDCDPEVLKYYGDIHCLKKGQLSLNAVKTWPGLKWAILDEPGQYLIMEPGQIHAVLSPVNSAVSGWSFAISDWIENGKLGKMMDWEMTLVEKRLENPEIGFDSPFISGGPVETMSNDLELWEMWLNSGVLSGQSESNLKSLLERMSQRLEEIKGRSRKRKLNGRSK